MRWEDQEVVRQDDRWVVKGWVADVPACDVCRMMAFSCVSNFGYAGTRR